MTLACALPALYYWQNLRRSGSSRRVDRSSGAGLRHGLVRSSGRNSCSAMSYEQLAVRSTLAERD